MPISDASYMLVVGTETATDNFIGAAVHAGPGPLDGMLLRTYIPAGGTYTAMIATIEESPNGVDTWTTVKVLGTKTAAGTDSDRIFWEQRYLRANVALTGVYTGMTMGLMQQGKELT